MTKRRKPLIPFSAAWKTFVADAIAKEPAKRSKAELAAIEVAEASWAAENPTPVMGRLWWRADDAEEFVSHVERVAEAGGRILSIDRSDPACISYIFEIDKTTADAKLGYAVEAEEWLIEDDETEDDMDYGKYDVIRYGSGYAVTDMQTHLWMHEKLIGDREKAFRLARKLAKADEQKRLADAAAADAAARAPKKKKRSRRK